jgi:hypothetical protein
VVDVVCEEVEPEVEEALVLPVVEPSVVESSGGVVLHATREKQSRAASSPASNLFVNIKNSFLCNGFVKLNKIR